MLQDLRYIRVMSELLRHIRACNNAILPGDRLPVSVAGQAVGWIKPAMAERAARHGARVQAGGLAVAAAALPGLARAMAQEGAFRWRGEAFDVRAAPEGPVLAQIDRGALPSFGIAATGIHVNGLVGDRLWIAHRALDKALDPGKLDHLCAGGVPAGLGPDETLVKEAAEEAEVPEALGRQARPVGVITYAMERQEGLRRDRLHCYDLELPPDFQPRPADGEVSHFELWPLADVLDRVRRTDDFKFNVNLVLIDLFLRRAMLPTEEAQRVRSELSPPVLA